MAPIVANELRANDKRLRMGKHERLRRFFLLILFVNIDASSRIDEALFVVVDSRDSFS